MTPAAAAAATGVLVAFVALVLRDLRRSTRPRALVSELRYPEARAAADRLAASWMRVLPGVRDGARYVSALARHLDGDLAGAAAELARLAPRDPSVRYATRTLEAACLVLEARSPDRALAAVREAREAARHASRPDDDVLEALALLALGRPEEAAERARDALASDPPEPEERLEAAASRALRGLLAVRLAEATGTAIPARARAELELAVRAAPGSVYARLAEATLSVIGREGDGAGPDDAHSSLAPQTLRASRPPRA